MAKSRHGVRVPDLALQRSEHRAVVTDGVARLPLRASVGDPRDLELRVPPRAPVEEERGIRADDDDGRAAEAEEFPRVDREPRDGGVEGLEGLELELGLDRLAEVLGRRDLHLGVVDVGEGAAEPAGGAEEAEPRVGVRLVRVAVHLLLHGLQAEGLLAAEPLDEGGDELARRGGVQLAVQIAVLRAQRVHRALQLADLLRLRAKLGLVGSGATGRGGEGEGWARAR